MSSSILPSEICRGPRWELAVKREMSLRELKMLAMANRASAISVGCHISHSSLGREELYWREERYGGKREKEEDEKKSYNINYINQTVATQGLSMKNNLTNTHKLSLFEFHCNSEIAVSWQNMLVFC